MEMKRIFEESTNGRSLEFLYENNFELVQIVNIEK